MSRPDSRIGWRACRWLCLLAGLCLSCQKVDLPSGGQDDAQEQAGQPATDGSGTGQDGEGQPDSYAGAYTVAGILSTYGDADLETGYEAGVVGYIVGSCTGTSISTALFAAEGASRSNLLIADTRTETDVDRCLPVELKNGTDVRDDLNLQDHPENLGQRVYVYALVKRYFRVTGLRETTYYEWVEEEDGTEGPAEPEVPADSVPEEPEEPEEPGPGPEYRDTVAVDDMPGTVQGGRIRTR